MKLYTKRGDQGNTNLIGGRTVRKDDKRVAAYGTLDELNSLVGYIISQCSEEEKEIVDELVELQHYLFDCGTDLADIKGKLPRKITDEQISWLEKRIDGYAEEAPTIESFILPGGDPVAALIQMARTVTRRAEREIVSLQNEQEINTAVFVFINRLSDYFFALARVINHRKGVTEPIYERGGKVFHNEEKQRKSAE
ncbi:cob(I)yrinic acid a,c-diamide adenosyltransferase [Atopococcus tabaci]|uniref:cob(I)yrinic acid a,c-diamide adenosyltransferase n=1 Tax=Atopococcus tabaci TaxID=269774 RepID=UPI000483A131|nr:cob(I)yrinic acid a,c-diamide adenosyltransferase [Atopococcus tabaci]